MTWRSAVTCRCAVTWRSAVTRRSARRHRRADGGWLSLELVGMFGLLLATVFAVLQVLAGAFALSEANTAARAAARAASLGEDPYSAAASAVSPSLRPVTVSGSGETWSVSVPVPVVVGWLPLHAVTRSATMPDTEH